MTPTRPSLWQNNLSTPARIWYRPAPTKLQPLGHASKMSSQKPGQSPDHTWAITALSWGNRSGYSPLPPIYDGVRWEPWLLIDFGLLVGKPIEVVGLSLPSAPQTIKVSWWLLMCKSMAWNKRPLLCRWLWPRICLQLSWRWATSRLKTCRRTMVSSFSSHLSTLPPPSRPPSTLLASELG